MGVRDVDGHLLTPGELGRCHDLLDHLGAPAGRLVARIATLTPEVHPAETDRP
jgi:hypothetical protein